MLNSLYSSTYTSINALIPTTTSVKLHNTANTQLVLSDNLLLTTFNSTNIVLPIIFIIFSFSLILVFNTNTFYFTKFTNFIEKELNALDDILFSIFAVILFSFTNIYFFFNFIQLGLNDDIFLNLVVIVCLVVFSTPLQLLLNYGFYFIISLKGASNTKVFLVEFLFDCINILAYFLRICIQLVRLVIMFLTYFMYAELYSTYTFDTCSVSYTECTTLTDYFTFILRFLFEINHTAVIFLVQFIAFNVVLF